MLSMSENFSFKKYILCMLEEFIANDFVLKVETQEPREKLKKKSHVIWIAWHLLTT